MVARKHFDAGKAAAALVASQRHLTRAAESGREPALVNPAPSAEYRNPGGYRAAGGVAAIAITDDAAAKIGADCNKAVRCDPELARIALALTFSTLLRLWIILRQLSTDTGRQGHSRANLDAALKRYGVKQSTVYTTRLLKQGCPIFWNVHNGVIYPVGYVELCKRLLFYAYEHDLDALYTTNHPGMIRDMYLDVSGTATDFEAAILAGWYEAHNNPTISRATLQTLFNRDRRSLWHLERLAGVTIIPNEAETTEPAAVPLNADGSDIRGDVWQHINRDGVIVYHYRMANTYQVRMVRQHPRRGQGRRAAYRFRQWFDTVELHTNWQGEGLVSNKPLVQVNPTGRIYCKDDKQAKRSRSRGNANTLYIRWKPGRGSAVVWRVDCVRLYCANM